MLEKQILSCPQFREMVRITESSAKGEHVNFQRSKINQAVVAALVSMTANQAGADQGVIEEVVVTATKRAESTQDIRNCRCINE